MQKQAPQSDDRYARDSFTFRQMKPWQLWLISLAAVLIILAMLVWVA